MRNAISPVFAAVLCVFLLSSCSGGKERQAEYFQRAQESYQQGRYNEARVFVKNALKIDDRHAEARYLLARLYEQEQNWREALVNLERAVEINPALIHARLKLGQLYYAGRHYDKAMQQAQAILTQQPLNADAHALLGSVYFRQNQPDRAIRQAEIALKEQPGHVAAVSILTEIYKARDPGRALAVIGDGIATQSKNATLKLLKIEVLAEQQRTQEIENAYRELITDYPENLFYHYLLVNFYQRHARIDDAESLIRKTIKTAPDNIELKLWLTQFLADQRHLQAAEQALKTFLAEQPGLNKLRFALGQVYISAGKLPEAEGIYRGIIKSNETSAESLSARNQLVKIALMRNDRRTAQALLSDIFALAPNNAEALVIRSRLDLEQGNAKSAIDSLRSAIKGDPDMFEALLLIAKAYLKVGAVDLARDSYRRALDVQPGHREALLALAQLELQKGDYASAIEVCQRGLAVNPADTQLLLLLANAYQLLGDYRQSADLYEEVLIQQPDNLLAANNLAMLYVEPLASNENIARAYDLAHDFQFSGNPALLDTLGWVYHKMGHSANAIAMLRSAVDSDESNPIYHYHLAMAYLKNDNLELARQTLQTALQGETNFVGREQAQALLLKLEGQ